MGIKNRKGYRITELAVSISWIGGFFIDEEGLRTREILTPHGDVLEL